ncbi:MAG: insulinase family protein [Archangium sp.]|nr:insulinase family protein [Archangium sp.]
MPSRFTLPNGLTVVCHPNHAARVVAFQVWVNVGSADETPDEVGLAHLHEHMLFKGTPTRGPGEIAHGVEAHGGEINAWTSYDNTVYHVVIATPFARHGLEVLADAVRHSTFDADELAREIEVVCEEIKRSLDVPSRRASKALFAESFPTHPYGRPVIGFEAQVRAHTRAGVLAFYEKHYAPQNMVLSIVGDLDEATAREWADATFGGDWGRPGQPRPPRPVEAPRTRATARVTVEEVKEAYVHLAFPIPSVSHPDTPALDVLAMVLGQGDASRLTLEVKRARGLVRDISAWAYTPNDAGIFAISLTTTQERVADAFDAALREVCTVTQGEVDGEELATAKSWVEAEAVYQRETMQGMARKLGYYEAAAGGLEREALYDEAVQKVTPAQLREVASRYLTLDRAVVSALVPPGTPFDSERALRGLREASAHPTRPALRVTGYTAPSKLHSKATAKPGLTVSTLSSGATVIVREERAVPLVSVRGAWQGGLRYETAAHNGLTALASRTWAKNTATLDPEQLARLLDRLGGSLSAVAGRSSMNLRSDFLAKHLARGFELFAEVATAPVFAEAEVQRERTLMLHDIASRDDRPASLVFDLFSKTLFQAHPYRLHQGGERNSVEGLTAEMLASYHRGWLHPSQLTLAVVGDVDTDDVLSRAEAAFGTRADAKAPPVIPSEPPQVSRRAAMRPAVKAQTHLMLGFHGARVSDSWTRALEVLTTVLSGQSGRLFIELRDKRSMAYSVSAMSVEGVDPGFFAVSMATSPEKVDDALAGIRLELQRVCDDHISPTELKRAQRYLIGTHEIGLQRNGARAGVAALDALYGLGADRFTRYEEEIGSVTIDAVRDVARRIIDFERETVAVVGPARA